LKIKLNQIEKRQAVPLERSRYSRRLSAKTYIILPAFTAIPNPMLL
jgi:hypothetical protein